MLSIRPYPYRGWCVFHWFYDKLEKNGMIRSRLSLWSVHINASRFEKSRGGHGSKVSAAKRGHTLKTEIIKWSKQQLRPRSRAPIRRGRPAQLLQGSGLSRLMEGRREGRLHLKLRLPQTQFSLQGRPISMLRSCGASRGQKSECWENMSYVNQTETQL